MRLLQGLGMLLLNAVLSQTIWAHNFGYQNELGESKNFQNPSELHDYQYRGYNLLSKSAYLAAYQTVLIYGLTRVPENWTNWDRERSKPKYWFSNWKRNISHKPVHDHDPFLVNYVGHPYSGMGYYVMARQTGFNQMESFLYSVFESTVIWEYGIEATVEKPSIQDLILTPTIGSIMGEVSYGWIQKIEENDGKLWGSQRWGTFATRMLSPFESITHLLRQNLRNGHYYTPKSQTNIAFQQTDSGRQPGQQMVLSWSMQF